MERIKRPERIQKMERGLFIIVLRYEIPAYRQAGLPVAGPEPNVIQLFGRHGGLPYKRQCFIDISSLSA
jgi:hypothetical protein